MEPEKYSAFKSIGETNKLSKYAETITISPGFRVNCSLVKKQLLLVRQVYFNEMLITTTLDESGKGTVWIGSNNLTIVQRNEDYSVVESSEKQIDFFMKNGVVISKLGSKVKFNKSLKIDFDDIPECITKYFSDN